MLYDPVSLSSNYLYLDTRALKESRDSEKGVQQGMVFIKTVLYYSRQ
jgi:hypothetical protein